MQYKTSVYNKITRNSFNYRCMLNNKSRYEISLLYFAIKEADDYITIEGKFDTSYKIDTMIKLDKNYNFNNAICSCPYNRRTEPCAHVIFIFLYAKERNLQIGYERPDSEEFEGLEFWEYNMINLNIKSSENKLKELIYDLTKSELYNNTDKAKLIPCFNGDSISFKVGIDKLYTVKNINKYLLTPVLKNELVTLGKNLTLNMSENNFDDFSKKILALLFKYPTSIHGANLIINPETFDDILELFLDTEYEMFEKKDFNLVVNIEKKGKNNSEIYITSKSNTFLYISQKNVYGLTDNGIIPYCNITEFENKLIRTLKNFYIKNTKLPQFIQYLNENLENIRINNVEEYIDDLKVKIYCDVDEDDNIIIRIKKDSDNLVKVVKIQSIFDILNISALNNFEFDKEYKIDKNKEKEIFFERALEELSKICDVYLSDFMKNYKKTRKINLSVGVKLSSNLLELKFSSDEISDEEILNILNEYRLGKKYYKLKNGERFLIDSNQFQKIDDVLKDFGFEKNITTKNAKLKVPLFRMYQLNNLDSDAMTYEKNKEIDKLFEAKAPKMEKRFDKILRDYQKEGVNWLLELRAKKLAGILADDMGLGKTLQIISYLESIKRTKPCIIVTPASLLLNWVNEFKKFNSKLEILPIYGPASEREKIISKIDKQIVVTTYDYLKKDIKKYEDKTFDVIIIDEAQYIKNHKTLSSNSVKEIKADYKIALTGTPIENSLAEIWSIFDFLMPSYLFTYSYFSRNYEKPIILENDDKVSNRLLKMVKPFILRRLKKNVLLELPEKIEENFYVDMEDEQIKLYKANAIASIKEISNLSSKDKIQVLAFITRLRQICIDPRLVYDNVFEPSPKIKATIELIKKSIENNRKVVLFSSFTKVLDLVIEECEKEKISFHLLTGETSKLERAKLVENFDKDDVQLFLISLKAGGTGLNLTRASVVIHLDPWWNISAQNQATDRTHRIGQKEIVQVFNIITKNSIEEKIQKLQEKKKGLSDTFIENSDGSFSSMSKEDLIELFKMDDNSLD